MSHRTSDRYRYTGISYRFKYLLCTSYTGEYRSVLAEKRKSAGKGKKTLKAVFGCRKMFSEKYIFSGNANFRKRKIFFRVWLHFKKFSGKYFLVFGKEKGKHKPKKNTINDRDLRSRSRRRDLAINGASSRRREIAIDLRSRPRDGAISRRRSRSEIAI